jgi:hypothetical protein
LLQRLDDLRGHVALIVLGEHGVGRQRPVGVEYAFGDDALPFAEKIGKDALVGDGEFTTPSAALSRLPVTTSPPSRIRLPGGTLFSTTSVGELKKTMRSESA